MPPLPPQHRRQDPLHDGLHRLHTQGWLVLTYNLESWLTVVLLSGGQDDFGLAGRSDKPGASSSFDQHSQQEEQHSSKFMIVFCYLIN